MLARGVKSSSGARRVKSKSRRARRPRDAGPGRTFPRTKYAALIELMRYGGARGAPRWNTCGPRRFCFDTSAARRTARGLAQPLILLERTRPGATHGRIDYC